MSPQSDATATVAAPKTGITEFFSGVAIASGIDVLSQTLAANPIIPDPWGGVVLAALGLIGVTIRAVIKRKARAAAAG